MYKFSQRSLECLESCHKDLKLIMNEALKVSYIDFGIVEGHRSTERQKQLFEQGKTKIDGINKKSKHNLEPSEAIDLIVSNNYSYDINHLCYLAGVIQTVAKQLKKEKKVSHLIRWGGNWDNDGVIINDQKFQDLVHFELS